MINNVEVRITEHSVDKSWNIFCEKKGKRRSILLYVNKLIVVQFNEIQSFQMDPTFGTLKLFQSNWWISLVQYNRHNFASFIASFCGGYNSKLYPTSCSPASSNDCRSSTGTSTVSFSTYASSYAGSGSAVGGLFTLFFSLQPLITVRFGGVVSEIQVPTFRPGLEVSEPLPLDFYLNNQWFYWVAR